MCGIAGFQGRSAVDVAAMTRAIAHRGPDADGHKHLVREGSEIHTQLGHRRLSIIDLSAKSNQPMTNPCAKCGTRSTAADSERDWIVFNGEIYNYRELRGQLSQQGHTFETASDTEILLHLFDEYGLDMFNRLNGIFAFAVYSGAKDRPALGLKQGDLMLARDHLGVKPLYYAETPGGLYFASEVKALTAAGLRFGPNLDVLRQFMTFLYGMAPDTPYEGVSKLEPGEVVVIRDGRLARKSSFYRLPFSRSYSRLSYGEAVAETERQVSAAVTRQMVADVPVGAFLSGGVDSSLVVAKAIGESGGRGIDCFTILDSTRPEGALDDNHFAHEFAKKRGIRLHDVPVKPSSLDLLEKVIYHMDEPHADVAAINSYLICQAASRQGTKVLLSGLGGDDVFSGYPRHRAATSKECAAGLPP